MLNIKTMNLHDRYRTGVQCRLASLACVACLAFVNTRLAVGQPKTWVPTGSAGWFVSGNWTPLGIPGSGSTTQINNGGTADADSGVFDVVSDRIEVGKNGTTGGMTVGGTSRNVTLGSDFDIGRIDTTVATGNVNVTSNGNVTISSALNVVVGNNGAGDIDVGSTSTGSLATGNGTGMLTVSNATLLDVFEDLDVAQAAAATSSTATAIGTFSINNVGNVDIGGDFDIGQAGGAGRAVTEGTADVSIITSMNVGLSLVAGRTSGSMNLGNSGRGTVTISDTSLNVGFGQPLTPGDIHVGDAIVAGPERSTAVGSVKLTRVTANVKRRINLGELGGGSTNSLTTTDATLSLVTSKVTTVDLDVATVVGTAGTAKGRLAVNTSLVDVTGAMTLGDGSELAFALGGTTRSTGTTAPGQYGALNAGAALLNGKLTVGLTGGFAPMLGNQFQVISATSATGAFDLITLPTLASGLSWNVTSNTAGVLLRVAAASLLGDYNGDGKVNAADYVVWRKNHGTAADYTTWRRNFGRMTSGSGGSAEAAPEASAVVIAGGLLPFWCTVRRRRQAAQFK